MRQNAASQSCQPTKTDTRQDVTPTPWRYRPDLHDDWGWIRGPQPDNGEIAPLVACARSGSWDDAATHDAHRAARTDPYGANAAFIVEAVNSYASLKARVEEQDKLLAEAADWLNSARGSDPQECGCQDHALPPRTAGSRRPSPFQRRGRAMSEIEWFKRFAKAYLEWSHHNMDRIVQDVVNKHSAPQSSGVARSPTNTNQGE